jgi:hypothetical protein
MRFYGASKSNHSTVGNHWKERILTRHGSLDIIHPGPGEEALVPSFTQTGSYLLNRKSHSMSRSGVSAFLLHHSLLIAVDQHRSDVGTKSETCQVDVGEE